MNYLIQNNIVRAKGMFNMNKRCSINVSNVFKKCLCLLILPLFVSACASVGAQKQLEAEFVGVTLSKSVDTSGDLAFPLNPTDKFSIDDPEVNALVKLENLSENHTLRWDWYTPDGELYYTTGIFSVGSSPGKILPKTSAWHKLTIKGDKAEDYTTGQWQVKVFFDENLKAVESFYLREYFFEDSGLLDISDITPGTIHTNDWALIIGIEDYPHLPKVKYAKRDALAVREYFYRILGVPEENIFFLLNQDATKARIEGHIKKIIPNSVLKDSTLYIYFAGHGAPDLEDEEPYLIPFDADIQFIRQSGYKLRDFYNDLDELNIKRIYVFLDSCFSGVASRDTKMLNDDMRPGILHIKDVQLATDGVIALSASSSEQISNAYNEMKHGLFTYFLLLGMKGDADENYDNYISVNEIYDYVKKNVSRTSRKVFSTDQSPQITPKITNQLKDIAITRIHK